MKGDNEMRSLWSEIRNDYTEDYNEGGICKITYIDAWKTADDNEEGKVIAKVLLTNNDEVFVVYIDNCAKYDAYAQEKIREAIDDFKKEVSPKYGIFYVDEKYVYRELEFNELNIKAPSLIAVTSCKEVAKFIAEAYNNDMALNG